MLPDELRTADTQRNLPPMHYPSNSPAFMIRRKFALALAAFALLAAPSGFAAVTCTLSATGPAFGTYNPLNAVATTSAGTVSVTCTLTTPPNSATVNVVTTYSTGSSNTYSTRTMKFGANILNYNIYYDAALTQIRGDGTGGSLTGGANFTLTNTTRTQSAGSTIYGNMPAGQDVAPGNYTDTITVTATY